MTIPFTGPKASAGLKMPQRASQDQIRACSLFDNTTYCYNLVESTTNNMGRKRRDCPVFGCGSTKLIRLANHLNQIHGMDKEERAKWLKWSKMGVCIPIQSKEGNNRDHGSVDVEKSLEKILNQQEEMEAKFYNYLREHTGTNQRRRKGVEPVRKQGHSCDERTDSEHDIAKKWLRF